MGKRVLILLLYRASLLQIIYRMLDLRDRSSTLENWCREFTRFAPTISVQTYYAGKEERPVLRQTLLETQRSTSKSGEGWEVLITTYNLAQGDDRDRKFFRKIEWDVSYAITTSLIIDTYIDLDIQTCVFDEGHVLKNFQSQRYRALLRYGSRWRLLLTGTPLQNNLQELVVRGIVVFRMTNQKLT
jgi:SWI/SNF-related matrix-associated actin-dependent regulator of chromatin subfamily A containing DEAD/H box 1